MTNPEENLPPATAENSENVLYSGARGAAIRILSRIDRSDSYLDKLLEYELRQGELNPMDKALLTEIVNGCVRWQSKLDWVLTGFYHGEYIKCLTPVKNAMRIALYQILFLDKIPAAIAINESVEIIKRIKNERSAGIVNAVLRNILRQIDNIRYPERGENPAFHLSIVLSHPQWMVRRWIEIFGESETEKLLSANNERPKTILRVNTLKASVGEVQKKLHEKNFSFKVSKFLPESIALDSGNIFSTEIFSEGFVAVQDTSASLAVKLADPKPGMRVLDMCAAPGGKSFFLADLMKNSGEIISLDKYEAKLKQINEGANRLGISIINTQAIDARKFKPDGELFDLVFVDAPCSGHGTLAKKPDIKWKREAEDITQMSKLQKEILRNAAALVKPGGALLYSTCTIEPEENTENIKWFLENFSEFSLDPAEKYLPVEVIKNGMMQTFPHVHHTDGAFAARLVRNK